MKAKLLTAAIALAPFAAFAEGESSDPASIVTSAGSLLTSIYPIVVGAVSFGILISLVKMVRRK